MLLFMAFAIGALLLIFGAIPLGIFPGCLRNELLETIWARLAGLALIAGAVLFYTGKTFTGAIVLILGLLLIIVAIIVELSPPVR